MGMTQHFHTIPTSFAIHVANYAHYKILSMHLAYSYALNEQGTHVSWDTMVPLLGTDLSSSLLGPDWPVFSIVLPCCVFLSYLLYSNLALFYVHRLVCIKSSFLSIVWWSLLYCWICAEFDENQAKYCGQDAACLRLGLHSALFTP